ncbi:MAG: helix-turn-helix domain-containing protein [Chloroflexota bacterium]|nr:helix-turn-helix domain-containing protein [Chloroflexota bacterium]
MTDSPLQQMKTGGSAVVLSEAKRRAVVLIAEGGKSYQAVADELGITRECLWRWRKEPQFAAALDDLRALLEEETRAYAVANRHDLLEGLTERRARLLRIVAEREEYHRDHQTLHPGATSGYLAKSYKVVGTGAYATTVEEWAVDAPLVKSLNETEKQGAVLAGIWTEKSQVEADIGIHAGPPTVVRIRSQRSNPYSPSNAGKYPAGKFEKGEDGIWRDVETGAEFDGALEAEFREVEPAPTGGRLVNTGVSDELDALAESYVAGAITAEELSRRAKELQDERS